MQVQQDAVIGGLGLVEDPGKAVGDSLCRLPSRPALGGRHQRRERGNKRRARLSDVGPGGEVVVHVHEGRVIAPAQETLVRELRHLLGVA